MAVLSKGANLRRTVQEFREFVWGLDTRSTPLGIVFSIPTYAESIIQEQGKDVLHRLKKHKLYYRLQDIYTQDFPSRLWTRYGELFDSTDQLRKVVEPETLTAIGQIAEREDLGEGPRTVIDSLKRAIVCYQDRNRAYTPIDLIDDFLQSNIRFQAQANKLKTVTRHALDSTAVDTDEETRAIKLMAAFPRGCPPSIQKKYGVYKITNNLSKQLHGELMTHLAEGYTLLGLRPSEGPTQLVDIIITRYWRGYEEDELHLEAATQAFMDRMLPRLFQGRRGGVTTGWGSLDFEQSAVGGYVALLEGTFSSRFPRRRLAVQVAYNESQFQSLTRGADLQLDFLLELMDHNSAGCIIQHNTRTTRFHLNVRQRVGPSMPDDIRKLQDFVNPEFVTPLLMLSLVNYFDRWEEIEGQPIPETDRAEVEHLVSRLIGHAEQLLFNRTVTETVDPPLHRVGRLMVEELFNRRCNQLFPDYKTLFVQSHYESVINDYINAMRDMTLKQRRGHALVHGTKDGLARRFGLGSVATFENRANNEYQYLLKISEWKGRGDAGEAAIELQLHPLETTILNRLQSSPDHHTSGGRQVPVMPAKNAAKVAGRLGYRDEETLLVLQLLAARGYIRFDQANKLIYLAQVGPDPSDLRSHFEQLEETLNRMTAALLGADELKQFRSSLGELQARFEPNPDDEEELDELKTLINDMDERLTDALAEKRSTLRNQLTELDLETERTLIALRQSSVLDRQVEGQLGFVQHLNELRQDLAGNRRRLAERYAESKAAIDQALTDSESSPISQTLTLFEAVSNSQTRLEALDEARQSFGDQVQYLERWIALLKKADSLFNALDRTPGLRDQLTRQVVPEIQAHLTKRKLDGLSDWEPFQAKVEAVEEELENRRRHGNELFGEVKDSYETFLRGIDVGDYRPRTRYTYGEDAASYRDLYEEVRSKIVGRLNEIAAELEQNQTDLLKARHIHILADKDKDAAIEIKKQLEGAEQKLIELRRALTIALIRNTEDELTSHGEQMNQVAATMRDLRQQLGSVLYADHDLTREESQTLEAFGEREETDLTDLFVQLRTRNSQMVVNPKNWTVR